MCSVPIQRGDCGGGHQQRVVSPATPPLRMPSSSTSPCRPSTLICCIPPLQVSAPSPGSVHSLFGEFWAYLELIAGCSGAASARHVVLGQSGDVRTTSTREGGPNNPASVLPTVSNPASLHVSVAGLQSQK